MITVKKKDETSIRIHSDDSGTLMEISEFFTFYTEGYRYMPAFKNKTWDGKVRIFDRRTNTLPYGLLANLADFAKSRGYSLNLDKDVLPQNVPSVEDITKFIDNLVITDNKNGLIRPRDYQYEAVIHAIRKERSLLISPTGSGKSLIIYILIRWFLSNNEDPRKKVLVVVPTTSLVSQLHKDFEDYTQQDRWFDASNAVHEIYSGKEKFNIDAPIIVTTWQSAINLPKSWFLQFGMVIGDEAHLFKAKSLTTIMSAITNAPFRIGTTGTLDNTQVHELVLTGSFGPVHRVTTTKALIDSNTLADLKIKCIVLKYEDEIRKIGSKMEYKDEIDFLVGCSARNNFIANLTVGLKGNSLVLFNLVQKHGKPLYELIKAKAGVDTKRKIFFVSGSTDVDDRERIRALVEKETDAIIVASSGTFSTGINIKNIHNIVFAAPTKSQVRVLQSIGRGLRKSDNDETTVVIDISDNLSWKSKKNHTMKHAIERVNIYAKESFNYKLYEIPLIC